MTRTLLIDGDIYAYQIACSDQTDVVFDGVPMSTVDPDTAIHNLDLLLQSFLERMEADRMFVALSDPDDGNFRKAILPTYKEARADMVRPIVREALHEHLKNAYKCNFKPDLEGDDILGIWATHPTSIKGEKIVVSGDKDLKSTIPGLHWNPKKDQNGEVVKVTEEQADYGHLFQTLTGDHVDGYKGCPGIGPVKAEKILFGVAPPWGTPAEAWAAVVDAYEQRGLTEEDALVQARVARILRATDYDFKNKQPILWSPE